ncbi:MAG: YkgJ family cysteine cluster protein [Nitrosarchaeum sp.]|nr:YkgJ family cysteine cluster protein [Nitrosarchaeum sp.]
MEFKCVEGCADCCINREYYPNKKFGKIGVLILPEEKQEIENMAKERKINVSMLPRIGTSKNQNEVPTILAYQMMGRENNGDVCPFLDTETENKSPHGGFPCKIYDKRPLACKTYPLIQTEPTQLDQKCRFCKECGHADKNLDEEMESLLKIKTKMETDAPVIWRYATGVGEESDKNHINTGWFLDE